ncbi:hypothetical protein SLS62_009251 [Diatrype stigma]|uniref:Amino acid permease n=1 Tax=Diatrype stigma TaxID=117547 RepID=A0AAN9YLS9_9PEZI
MTSTEQKDFSGRSKPEEDFEQGQPQLSSTTHDAQNLTILGYKPQLHRNRSMFTLLFQSLAIAAQSPCQKINTNYGMGGGMSGQLPMFVGWIAVLFLSECVALSLGELASRYPTSAGPYYWSFQLASPRYRTVLSFVTGWTWLIGNWTITLSVNFGFASLVAATAALFHPDDFAIAPWQLLLIFYAMCFLAFAAVAFGNRLLPAVDTACAAFTAVSILVTCVCLSAKAGAGRHSPSFTLVMIGFLLS